jgi:hypothetical protein
MVDARILGSEWVYAKPEGGHALKPGAPADVKKAFAEYKRALEATKASSKAK